MRNLKFADVPPGTDSPLNAAITGRDQYVLQMVSEAVKHNQTVLAFQPVMIAHNRTVGFYEGLMRVLDETGRVIPAKDFMPVVERAELGREIDTIALNMGLRTLHQNPSLRLSINMSARSIGYQRWMNTLRRWVKKDSTLGERLILEITEGSAMDQPELVVDFMNHVSRHGVCFALDDFGSGYTSFRYFKQFFFDILKIDIQFCHGISRDPDTRALAQAMVDIGHRFNMLVVGEGVERKEDVDVLSEIGVDCLQGYYFEAPTVRPNWMFAERQTAQASNARA